MAEMRFHVRPFEVSLSWHVRCNLPMPGWRGWLGHQLRRLAARVDRCHTLGLRFDTQPPIGVCAERQIVRAGVDFMTQCAGDLAHEAAVDLALPQVYPDLVDRP